MLRDLARLLVANLVFASLLGVGLQTPLADLRAVLRNHRLLLRSLLVIELGVPLLAIGLVAIFPTPRTPASVILLFAICPGVALLPFMVRKRRGDLPTAVGLLLIITAFAPVTVPLWLAVLDRVFPYDLHVDIGRLVVKLVPTVLLPLGLGMLVRR